MNEISGRRYDIDVLRSIGVLLLVPFHTFLMFDMSPDSLVYIKSGVSVPLFVTFSQIIRQFHMPVLFLLAGMSAWYSLKKRSASKFLGERVKKLLIPLVAGSVILNPFMTYVWCSQKCLDFGGTYSLGMHLTSYFTSDPEDLSGFSGGFSVAHLWFLLYLFIFSLVVLPFCKILLSQKASAVLKKMADVLSKPLVLLVFIVPMALLYSTKILGTKNPFVYFFMFFLGFMLMTDDRYTLALNRDKWVYSVLSVVLITVRLFVSSSYVTLWYFMFAIAVRIVPVFALLGLANCYWNKNSSLLSRFSKASFPFYIFHFPVDIYSGLLVFTFVHAGVYLQYVLIVSLTFGGTYILYRIVSFIPFVRFLFGIGKNK